MAHDKRIFQNFMTAAQLERWRRKGGTLDEAQLIQLQQAREYVQMKVTDPVAFILDFEDTGLRYRTGEPDREKPRNESLDDTVLSKRSARDRVKLEREERNKS